MIAAISIEGVLAQGFDLRKVPPTKQARLLYDSLRTQYRIIGFTQADPEIAQWWLKGNFMPEWAAVMTKEAYLAIGPWKVRQIEDFLAEGWEVGLVIDTDPEVLAQVNDLGVTTMLMSYPTIRIGWKPHEVTPRPWTALADTLDQPPKGA